jgi:trans-aconitate methyltransferase
MVCDWGCRPMRFLRHLSDIYGPTYLFIGLDYNKKTIEWAKTYFPEVDLNLNDLYPHLTLKNASVDVLYCISVFSHLSEDLFRAYV